ncbi:Pyridoxal phosphate-dependent transferase major region subdomain 2 [Penicillium expansum]|nr:Pyridoxal phosphate-dependent transferase major region subdomain 2 [Penicillium expansum]
MFDHIPPGPVDPFFHLKKKADRDNHPNKVDIGVGIYRNEQGTYQELVVVKKVITCQVTHDENMLVNYAKKILDQLDLGHDYGLTTGDDKFLKLAAEVMFGEENEALVSGRIASVQTLSGTGANHIAAILMARSLDPKPTIYLGVPTWNNMKPLCEYAGLETVEYPYIDTQTSELSFQPCIDAIRNAPAGSVFVLQGCCHNPTGKDITPEQWQLLGEEIKARGHLPFIDIAYQGLGDGLDEDAVGVRILSRLGIDMIVCQSFSKNFALYGERCGVLYVVTRSAEVATNTKDQLRSLIRREYSSSPAYGSRLVTIVLEDTELRRQWHRLHEELTMVLQCNALIDDHHVHLPVSGRINIAGLNTENVERTARAIDAVVRGNMP